MAAVASVVLRCTHTHQEPAKATFKAWPRQSSLRAMGRERFLHRGSIFWFQSIRKSLSQNCPHNDCQATPVVKGQNCNVRGPLLGPSSPSGIAFLSTADRVDVWQSSEGRLHTVRPTCFLRVRKRYSAPCLRMWADDRLIFGEKVQSCMVS
jgi:hypothetical protein